jgi:serine/threonine-protein kinase
VRTCSACSTSTDDSGRFCPACGTALVSEVESASASLVGRSFDGFSIDGVLGGGAFGTVFRGTQRGLERQVAIKIPTYEILSDPTMAKRFSREARSAAKIQHPGVVAIYAVGELADGRPYLAMQLIDGQQLDKILEEGPINAERALKIIRMIASALAETHAQNVIHRDLKPANVMWRQDRLGDDVITIVDFGIAVAKPGNADATRLTTAGLIGTPHYMSPEQAQGETIDHRSDIYALGCMLFELVTNETPFSGSGMEVLLAHMGRPVPAPSDRNPAVPAAVDRVVRSLMAKRVYERPQTADEVVALIDDALSELAGEGGHVDRSGVGGSAKTQRAKRKSQYPTARELPADPAPDETIDPIAATRALPDSLDSDAPDDDDDVAPLPPPPAKGRWIALGTAIGLVVALGGVATYRAVSSSPAKAATTEPSDEPGPGSGVVGRKTIISDDGEMSARTTIYDPIIAGINARTQIELWNAIGAPVEVPELVVTVEDPAGKATGTTARASRDTKGRFGFSHVFPTPGHYVIRIFPPEGSTVFTLDVDVEAR